jgi:hypothetical protein
MPGGIRDRRPNCGLTPPPKLAHIDQKPWQHPEKNVTEKFFIKKGRGIQAGFIYHHVGFVYKYDIMNHRQLR